MTRFLTAEQVLFIHARVIHETGGEPGIRDIASLRSALALPQTTENGTDKFPGLLQKTAVLFNALIKKPIFVDGNKRTAISVAGIFLSMNGQKLVVKKPELIRFAKICAATQTSVDYAVAWFWQYTQPTE